MCVFYSILVSIKIDQIHKAENVQNILIHIHTKST